MECGINTHGNITMIDLMCCLHLSGTTSPDYIALTRCYGVQEYWHIHFEWRHIVHGQCYTHSYNFSCKIILETSFSYFFNSDSIQYQQTSYLAFILNYCSKSLYFTPPLTSLPQWQWKIDWLAKYLCHKTQSICSFNKSSRE